MLMVALSVSLQAAWCSGPVNGLICCDPMNELRLQFMHQRTERTISMFLVSSDALLASLNMPRLWL